MFLDAMGSVQRGIEVVEFAVGAPHLLKGEHSESVGRGVDAHSRLQPVGVCAGITPFNFPAMVPMWMFPMALACGNTFVLKPSEKDPSAERPHGGAAQGSRPARRRVQRRARRQGSGGRASCIIPDIKAVSFVGSTPIAKYIYATAAANGQARAGARRREEPRGRAARRRSRLHRRRADGRRRTARPANAAWRFRPSSPSATSAIRSSRSSPRRRGS